MLALIFSSVLMTVLFGSSATTSTRAPTRASEDNDDSLNRLFDDTVTDAEDLAGDKMVIADGCLLCVTNKKNNFILFPVLPCYSQKV